MFLEPESCHGVVRIVDEEGVQCGCSLGVPDLKIRKESLIGLDWGWEVENVYEVAFPFLVGLTLFDKVGDSFAVDYGQSRDGRMEFGVEFGGDSDF